MDNAILLTFSLSEFEMVVDKVVKQRVELLRDDCYLSRSEVAKLLGCSSDTVKRYSDKGHLKVYGEGRPRYLKSEILRWKENKM